MKIKDESFKMILQAGAEYCDGVIMPDGEYLLTDNHLNTLVSLTGKTKETVWNMIPSEDSALFWLIAYTGCVVTDYNASVGIQMTKEQKQVYDALVEHGVILDKYYDISKERRQRTAL